MRLALLLAPALLLGGCTLVQEPEVRELAGPTDGYTPTASFLKLNVRRDDGTIALLDFDRRDWYAAKIAELVDHKKVRFVSAQALPRDILNEYLAQNVTDPSELARLRFDVMEASPEQRQEMDNEYESLLQRHLAAAPVEAPELLPIDAAKDPSESVAGT